MIANDILQWVAIAILFLGLACHYRAVEGLVELVKRLVGLDDPPPQPKRPFDNFPSEPE